MYSVTIYTAYIAQSVPHNAAYHRQPQRGAVCVPPVFFLKTPH